MHARMLDRAMRTSCISCCFCAHAAALRTPMTSILFCFLQGIAKQLVRALHYLHSNRIIHRSVSRVAPHVGAVTLSHRRQSRREAPVKASRVSRKKEHFFRKRNINSRGPSVSRRPMAPACLPCAFLHVCSACLCGGRHPPCNAPLQLDAGPACAFLLLSL